MAIPIADQTFLYRGEACGTLSPMTRAVLKRITGVLSLTRPVSLLFLSFGVYISIVGLFWGPRLVGMPTMLDMYRHPFVLGKESPYLHGSPLGPIMGNLLGITDKWSLYMFYLFFIALALVAIFFYVRHIAKKDVAMTASLLVILALSPLLNVLFTWVGLSDPLLVLAYIGFLIAPSAFIQNGAVMLMLLAHREQALLILVFHLILNPTEWRRIVRVVPGILLALAWFYYYSWILGGFASRADGILGSFSSLRPESIALTIVLICGWFWIVLAHVWTLVDWQKRVRLAIVTCTILVVSCILTLDNTRVAAMLSLPVYFFVLKTYADRSLRLSLPLILLFLLLGAVQIEASAWMPLYDHWWWFHPPIGKLQGLH